MPVPVTSTTTPQRPSHPKRPRPPSRSKRTHRRPTRRGRFHGLRDGSEQSGTDRCGARPGWFATPRHNLSAIEHPAVMEPTPPFGADTAGHLTVVAVQEPMVEGASPAGRPGCATPGDGARLRSCTPTTRSERSTPISEIAALTKARGVLLAYRRSAIDWQDPGRRECAGSGPAYAGGSQVLRTERDRCTVHPTGSADQGTILVRSRRRSAWLTSRYGEHPGHRGDRCRQLAWRAGSVFLDVSRRLQDTSGRASMCGCLRVFPRCQLNGHPDERLPNTLNVSFPGVAGRDLLRVAEDQVFASVGSACHSENDAPSGVLAAIGADAGRARGAVRLSVGRLTTLDDVEQAAYALISAWRRISTGRD